MTFNLELQDRIRRSLREYSLSYDQHRPRCLDSHNTYPYCEKTPCIET